MSGDAGLGREEERALYVVSNASGVVFPGNTLTHFSNEIPPSELWGDSGSSWDVAFKRLYLDFYPNDIPRYVTPFAYIIPPHGWGGNPDTSWRDNWLDPDDDGDADDDFVVHQSKPLDADGVLSLSGLTLKLNMALHPAEEHGNVRFLLLPAAVTAESGELADDGEDDSDSDDDGDDDDGDDDDDDDAELTPSGPERAAFVGPKGTLVFLDRNLARTLGFLKLAERRHSDASRGIATNFIPPNRREEFEERYGVYQVRSSTHPQVAIAPPSLKRLLPSYIQIMCNILKPYASSEAGSGGYTKCLYAGSLSHLVENSHGGGVLIEPNRVWRFKCANLSHGETIQVRLLDAEGYPLNLLPGQPTLLQLGFYRHSIMDQLSSLNAFSVRVSSRDGLDLEPDNCVASFSLEMSPPLQMVPDPQFWTCSLRSITLPYAFAQLELNPEVGGGECIEVLHTAPDNQNQMGELAGDREVVPFPYQRFESPSHLVRLINYVLIENLKPLSVAFALKPDGGVSIICRDSVSLRIPWKLALMLGDPNAVGDPGETHARYTLVAGEKRALLGHPDVMKFVPHTLNVYANFVRPSIVGDSYEHLLKVVAIPQNADMLDRYVTCESEHVDAKMIKHRTIASANFNIRTPDGKPVSLMRPAGGADDQHALLQLVFEPIRDPRRAWRM
jgi:hypothetical protein